MVIGIDIGGTNIRCGLIENGQVLEKLSEPCLADKSENEVLEQLKGMIDQLMNSSVKGIGIGIPSVVDTQNGIVYNVVNIPSWEKVYLKDIMEAKYNIPVYVNNDSNCFTLGEYCYGQGKPFNNMIGVTLGTGVGAGVIINKNLYCGENAGAGEIGCLPYLKHNFEYYCSSNFFVEFYKMTGIEAAKLALNGDVNILKAWEEFGFHLGMLVKAILYTYDPDAIIFGGGLSGAHSFFSAMMNKTMTEFEYPETIRKIQILISSHNDISLLGASRLVKM